MNIIDLSHTIGVGTKGFPGCAQIVGWPLCSTPKQDYNMLHVSTDLHTGTHLDAPRHCIHQGKPIDHLRLEDCVGTAWVVDLTKKGLKGATFTADDFSPFKDEISEHQRLIIKTGWSQYWETEDYHDDFPGFSREAAQCLVDMGLKLIAVEQASIHPSDHLAIHQIFLEREVVIVEGIANAKELPSGVVEFFAAPLKFKEGDGSPIRAFARLV